jgi:hypothetical protein
MTDEQKKKGLELAIKLGIIGIVGFLVAPFVFIAIGGIVGLILAIGIGFLAIQFAPVVAMKVANLKMKAIENEASKNPIETMKNIYAEGMKEIQKKQQKIIEFSAKVEDYGDKLAGFKKQWPDDAPKFVAGYEKMKASLVKKRQKQTEAIRGAKEYELLIDKAEAVYDMAKSALEVDQMDADIEGKIYNDIKNKVAFDTVNHTFNRAIAEMSAEVDDQSAFGFALPSGSDNDIIPAVLVDSAEKVSVKRN